MVKEEQTQRPWNKKDKVWLDRSEQKVVLQDETEQTG